MASSNVELADIFAPFPRFRLQNRQTAVYRQFRILAPSLVSLRDDAPANSESGDELALFVQDEPVGVVSYCVSENKNRKVGAAAFARIDLVITHPAYRGKGYGKVLLLAALTCLLRDSGDRLYSISCLAAHPAIAKMLEELGFHGELRDGQNFKLETLNLNAGDAARSEKAFSRKLTDSLRASNYRFRQGTRRP